MITLSKPALVEAMKKCLPGVEKGSSLIEGADTFLFTPGFVHTYNDAIAVSAPVEYQGPEISVKAVDFFRLVSKLNAPMVQAEIKDQKLVLTGGRTRATMTLTDPSKLKTYLDTLGLTEAAWADLPGGFEDGVKLCKMSCNTTPLRGISIAPNSAGVSAVMATDSSRISMSPLKGNMPQVWLDDPDIGEMMKLGEMVQYAIQGAWFHIKYKDGVVFSCKKKDHAQYPVTMMNQNLDACIAAPAINQGRLPKDLGEAVDRVSTMASGTTEKQGLIRLTFHQDGLELYARKVSGDAQEVIPWEKPLEADPGLVVWVETDFLVEASRKVMDYRVIDLAEQKVMVFTSEDYIQMVATDVVE